MIAQSFLKLTDYPSFRRIIWKPIYEALAKKIKVPDWHFMNYGYMPSVWESPLKLKSKDEISRYSLQLYHYLVSIVDVTGVEMLEVGTGRGEKLFISLSSFCSAKKFVKSFLLKTKFSIMNIIIWIPALFLIVHQASVPKNKS